jgi:hypothetical protein
MLSIATVNGKSKNVLAIAIAISMALPIVVGSLALAAQDRYTLKKTGSHGLTSEDTKPGKMLR